MQFDTQGRNPRSAITSEERARRQAEVDFARGSVRYYFGRFDTQPTRAQRPDLCLAGRKILRTEKDVQSRLGKLPSYFAADAVRCTDDGRGSLRAIRYSRSMMFALHEAQRKYGGNIKWH